MDRLVVSGREQPLTHETPAILELVNVSKQFPGVTALEDINLTFFQGEIHALVGENGAGKSTLAKIIAGVYPPTSGELRLFGQKQQFASPHEAQKMGIGILYQEMNVLPELNVAENVFLGNEPHHPALPIIDWKAIYRRTQELLERVGLRCSPWTPVSALSVAHQQMVQVIKALHYDARLLVMDEPTTRLTEFETRDLFKVLSTLKQQGVTVIFVSHRLEEVKSLCDRATILREGRVVKTVDVAGTTLDSLTAAMLGRHLGDRFPRRSAKPGEELLRVQGLTRYGAFEDVDFTLHAGEILGITGLVGSGRTALLRAIFGMEPIDEGQFYINRHLVKINSPQDAIMHGLGLLTEDRQHEGLVLEMGIGENITLASLENESSGMLIDHSQEAEVTEYYIRELRIKTPHPDFKTRFLSGGNQQKIVLSKWLATGPRVLLCDEPTQGIDIGAKKEIYRLMDDLVGQGIGIVMVSADISEILGLCDRFIVLHEGRAVCTLNYGEADEETVLRYAQGGQREA